MRIFISYRRDDSAGYAGRIYDRLAEHFGSESIFMDIDAIEPGEDFVEVIQRAVRSYDVLIALIGKRWTTVKDESGRPRLEDPNDFVHLELATALSREIRVIPVLVGGADMPGSQALPEPLKRLRRRNALEVSDARFHHDVDRLVEALENVAASLAAKREARQAETASARAEAAQRREVSPGGGLSAIPAWGWALGALVLAGLFIGVVVGGYFLFRGTIGAAAEPTEVRELVDAQTETPAATLAPTETVQPPTLEPTLTPTITVPPGVRFVRINGITIEGGAYIVEYETFEYTEVLPGMHVHFFFDTVAPEDAGVPGAGPWILYGGPRPFMEYTVADRPPEAMKMCALVANSNHSVQADSGNCFDLPG